MLSFRSLTRAHVCRLLVDAAMGRLTETEVQRAIQIRDIVTSLGPAYIKLGQALSIRPDLLSPAAMNELQKLCDKVPSYPNDQAMAVIEEELGSALPHHCHRRHSLCWVHRPNKQMFIDLTWTVACSTVLS